MTDTAAPAKPSGWHRFRRRILYTVLALVAAFALRLALPDTDFGRGSPARYWSIAFMAVVLLTALGIELLWRRRRDSARQEHQMH